MIYCLNNETKLLTVFIELILVTAFNVDPLFKVLHEFILVLV